MARLSQSTIATVQYQSPEAIVETKSKSWLDYLPHGCELPQLFRTGLPFKDCLELINKNEKALNKTCRTSCSRTVKSCFECWKKAADALILSQQVDKAAGGDSSMLIWTGKAKLRQTEPVEENQEIVPSQINILGLNVNQEKEIDKLRAELKALKQRLPDSQDETGDA